MSDDRESVEDGGSAHNAEEPAIRPLTTGDTKPRAKPQRQYLRWLVPLAVVMGLLVAFFVANNSSSTSSETTSTESTIASESTTDTLPPSTVAAAPETIDLRSEPEVATTAAWGEVPFEQESQVHDVVRDGDIYLAGGSRLTRGALTDAAQVWWSQDAVSWQAAGEVASPEGRSSIDRMVVWGDRVVALGTVDDIAGVWTSDSPEDTWAYQGGIAEAQGALATAGEQLRAISWNGTEWISSVSTDGISWDQTGPTTGLTDAVLYGLASKGAIYLAYGERKPSRDTPPQPVVYWSSDGIEWQPVELAQSFGEVTDVAVTPDGFLALGWDTEADSLVRRMAIWESSDGVDWERVGADEPLFAATQDTIALIDSGLGASQSATIDVDGTTVAVTVGTTIDTDVGAYQVTGIGEGGVELSDGLSSESLRVGDGPLVYPIEYQARTIAVSGSRLAIVGIGTTTNGQFVWTSTDGGHTWNREFLPGVPGDRLQVTMDGETVTLIASTTVAGRTPGGNHTEVWTARWLS